MDNGKFDLKVEFYSNYAAKPTVTITYAVGCTYDYRTCDPGTRHQTTALVCTKPRTKACVVTTSVRNEI